MPPGLSAAGIESADALSAVPGNAGPWAAYRRGVAAGRWQDDAAQHGALDEFERLHAQLMQAAPGVLQRTWRRMLGRAPAAPHGLYLWGPVGRGKSFLMDLFVETLPSTRVERRHFHRFMRETHEKLRRLGQRSDPLRELGARLARHARVLCLDEFQVSDIGDAMILDGLLRALDDRGVCLVTTSNTPPQRLYHDGLQRARFLPAIELIEQRCRVLELSSPHDWRLRELSRAPLFLTPADAGAERALARLFEGLARGRVDAGGTLDINGRAIAFKRAAEDAVWFDFGALCEGPRSAADYIELAREYPAVLISAVPQFTAEMADATRRFTHLVDEFYDRRVKLALSAAAPVSDLYQGARLRTVFARAESRLIEMQSEAYLARAHRP